jgi:hypothetical protein
MSQYEANAITGTDPMMVVGFDLSGVCRVVILVSALR